MAEGVPATFGKSRQRLGVAATPQQLGLTIPPLRIKHAVKTREEIAAGVLPGTWEFRKRNLGPTVDVVFLAQKNIRTYQVRDGERVQTRCASSDGVVPIPEAPVPQAATCAACPRAVWEDVVKDGRVVFKPEGRPKQTPPDCTSGYAFLGLLMEEATPGQPCWLVCKGTAERPAKEFLREWDAQGHTGLFEWRVRLELKEDRSGGLTWYLPTFTVVEEYPLEKYMAAYEYAAGIEYVHFIGRDQVDDEDGGRPRDVTPRVTNAGFRDDVPPPTDDDLGI